MRQLGTFCVWAAVVLLVLLPNPARAKEARVEDTEKASAHEKVWERGESSDEDDEEQDKMWNTGDRDGGSTIILSNRNSIQAYDSNDKEKVEQMKEQMRKQTEEHTEKREGEATTKKKREERRKKREKDYAQNQKKKEAERKKEAEEDKKQADKERKQREKAAEAKAKETAKQRKEATEKRLKKQKEAADKRLAKQKLEQAKKQEARKKEARKKKEEQAAKKNFKLQRPWRNYGGSYETPRSHVFDGICFLSGLARGSTGMVGKTPSNCRPPHGRLVFTAVKSGHPSRIDVLRDGRVYYITGPRHGWLSLNGLTFAVSRFRGISLVRGWRNYGYGYAGRSVHKTGDFCLLHGLIRSGSWSYIGRISGCRPHYRIIMSGNNHHHVTRLDVLRNSYIVYSGGHRNHGWVSLSGLGFMDGNGGRTLRLHNHWRPYGGGYRGPRWNKSGRVCAVSGLIKNHVHWTRVRHIATLPGHCRPKKRLIFGLNVHTSNARVDVLPNGALVYINGKQHWNWISLTGIAFFVQTAGLAVH